MLKERHSARNIRNISLWIDEPNPIGIGRTRGNNSRIDCIIFSVCMACAYSTRTDKVSEIRYKESLSLWDSKVVTFFEKGEEAIFDSAHTTFQKEKSLFRAKSLGDNTSFAEVSKAAEMPFFPLVKQVVECISPTVNIHSSDFFPHFPVLRTSENAKRSPINHLKSRCDSHGFCHNHTCFYGFYFGFFRREIHQIVTKQVFNLQKSVYVERESTRETNKGTGLVKRATGIWDEGFYHPIVARKIGTATSMGVRLTPYRPIVEGESVIVRKRVLKTPTQIPVDFGMSPQVNGTTLEALGPINCGNTTKEFWGSPGQICLHSMSWSDLFDHKGSLDCFRAPIIIGH
jgi:hypothetical protein